jgi:hypothetical protein
MKVIKYGTKCKLTGTCQYCGTEIECGISEAQQNYNDKVNLIYTCPVCMMDIILNKKEPQLLNE